MTEERPDESGTDRAEQQAEENATGVDPSVDETNTARQGPGEARPASPPTEERGHAASGPPPESIPGDSGEVPNPQQN